MWDHSKRVQEFLRVACLMDDILYDNSIMIILPVVPHKAVAEVSKIGNL